MLRCPPAAGFSAAPPGWASRRFPLRRQALRAAAPPWGRHPGRTGLNPLAARTAGMAMSGTYWRTTWPRTPEKDAL